MRFRRQVLRRRRAMRKHGHGSISVRWVLARGRGNVVIRRRVIWNFRREVFAVRNSPVTSGRHISKRARKILRCDRKVFARRQHILSCDWKISGRDFPAATGQRRIASREREIFGGVFLRAKAAASKNGTRSRTGGSDFCPPGDCRGNPRGHGTGASAHPRGGAFRPLHRSSASGETLCLPAGQREAA